MTPLRALIALLAALALAACAGTGADGGFPDGSTMAKVRERGVLTVGIKFDYPLFGYKDPAGGRITGFDAEIARLVAKDLTGSERGVRFVETMPSHREDFLRRGVVDVVIATYSITPARQQVVGFTDPYYVAGQDLLVRAGETGITGVTDLDGRTVCTASGSTSADRLRELAPGAELLIVDTYSECVPALVAGRIDAISTDDAILRGLLGRAPDALKLVGRPFGREPYGIGVPRHDVAFRDHLSGLIARYLRDGRWERAFRDTIGLSGATPEQARPPARG